MAVAIRHYSADGATTITGKVWPNAQAGLGQTALKFALENISDRTLEELVGTIVQIAANDGYLQFRWGLDTATLSRPWGVVLTLGAAGAGGVWSAIGTYGYRITAINATGETIGSIEKTVTVDVTTKKVTLDWTQVTGATSYKIYRTATPGTYGASVLRTTIGSGATITFLDDGSATSSGTPPVVNTTGGAGPTYGTPPSLSSADLTIGDVAIGQEIFYWCNRVIPLNATEVGNPRLSMRRFYESAETICDP